MRVRRAAVGLPTAFINHPHGGEILSEGDIRPGRRSTLSLKVLVFPTKRALRRFWKAALGNDLGTRCAGVVNKLSNEHIAFVQGGDERRWIEVDPRYFAIMGLVRTQMSAEVIAHESAHAAFAYYHRHHNRDDWPLAEENGEEMICYPLGRIAELLGAWLKKKGYIV